MNAVTGLRQTDPRPPQTRPGFIADAYGDLQVHVDRLAEIEGLLDDLGEAGNDLTRAGVRKLKRQIREFAPSVTMIGQVKAGKTTLVNSMIGWPDLLPADINPWTSVVTSLHLKPGERAGARSARFRFFSEEEWNNLLTKGGRVGELAQRAGADRELEKVRAQLEAMREKSRQRLGRKFEMLLGQEHEYGYFDEALIERYVCLGDDFDSHTLTNRQQGRFADITKSADLTMVQPELPMGLCVRDTPGVNDTFMIREQITVNAIRDSRLCVVVLSAHQALSTVDMALIRLISNIKSREVVIFVNRIDELGDPARDVPEIRDSIRETLKAHDAPVDAEIIFGSAYWAMHALQGTCDALGEASAQALLTWAESTLDTQEETQDIERMVWRLSGVPQLARTIAARVRTGEGAEFEEKVFRATRNLANGLAASRNIVARRTDGGSVKPVERARIGREIDAIAARSLGQLDARFEEVLTNFDKRLASAERSFLGRATSALVRHLEVWGEHEVWNYDPAGLRVLLKSAYRVFASGAAKTAEGVVQQTTSDIRDLYIGAFGLPEAEFALEGPVVPVAPPPVMLGKTIALDMKGNWWSRWWRRRRSHKAYAEEYAQLISLEIAPVIAALRSEHAEAYRDSVKALLAEFIDGQRRALLDLAEQTEVTVDELNARFAESGGAQWSRLESTMTRLAEIAGEENREVAQ